MAKNLKQTLGFLLHSFSFISRGFGCGLSPLNRANSHVATLQVCRMKSMSRSHLYFCVVELKSASEKSMLNELHGFLMVFMWILAWNQQEKNRECRHQYALTRQMERCCLGETTPLNYLRNRGRYYLTHIKLFFFFKFNHFYCSVHSIHFFES